MGWRRWAAPIGALVALSTISAGLAPSLGTSYVELPGVRCSERVDHHPLGHPGGAWTEYLHREAERHCDADDSCVGLMRYLGDNPVHCRFWCGRPQFCNSSGNAEPNSLWVSYIKHERVEALGLPEQDTEDYREVECGDYGRVSRERVVILSDILPELPFEDACYVLHRAPGLPSLSATIGAKSIGLSSRLAGELVESEDEDLRYMAAEPSERGPRRYFFDPNVFPGGRIHRTPKTEFMSIYFSSIDAVCPSPEGSMLTLVDAESVLPGHVFVEDGSEETRQAAFSLYQVTLFCGDFMHESFPPLALVHALAYSAHPVVPRALHGNLSRIYFHLPDAVQAYRSVDIGRFRDLLWDIYNNPDKEDAVRFKHTFNALSAELLFYRYGEPAGMRAEAAACSMCESRKRDKTRAVFATLTAAGPTSWIGDPKDFSRAADASVEFVFCSMSRRAATDLRRTVRETWAGLLRELPFVALRFFVGLLEEGSTGGAADGVHEADVVELGVLESYRTINVKAFLMLDWAFDQFPHLQWLLRHDDDVYLRPLPVLAQLRARPPVRYIWGSFDHGSTVVRDPGHLHYNSYEQCPEHKHPFFGDVFPPYARGHLWAMSADLLGEVVKAWRVDVVNIGDVDAKALADRLPHPDDPALGIVLANLVAQGLSINLDDRDFNVFSLNPSCNSTFSNIHERTWVVHHVSSSVMKCMWAIDEEASSSSTVGPGLPDLCPCSGEVPEEEDSEMYSGTPFSYPKSRFNEG